MCRLLCLKAVGSPEAKFIPKDLHLNDQLRRFWDFGSGVIVMPCLIFLVGRIALGPYAHGSVFALWRDFIIGLVSGSQAVWFIALGPYLLVLLLRGGRRLLHN